MKDNDFHKPFLDSMVIIAFVTIVLLFSSREIMKIYSSSEQKSQQYTSQQSYDSINEGSEE